MTTPNRTPTRSWRPTSGSTVPWPRVADALAVMCLLAAMAIWFWPVRVAAPTPLASATMSTSGTLASSVSPIGSADSLIAVSVNGNVFSATRRAPTVRFVVPGSVDAAAAMPIAAPADSALTTADAESMPRLSGIVSVAGERRALLQLVAADGHASLYRAGDVHAGYRIVRIEATYVVLAHGAGTRTLRLSDRRQDSLEVSRE